MPSSVDFWMTKSFQTHSIHNGIMFLEKQILIFNEKAGLLHELSGEVTLQFSYLQI